MLKHLALTHAQRLESRWPACHMRTKMAHGSAMTAETKPDQLSLSLIPGDVAAASLDRIGDALLRELSPGPLAP